MVKQGPVNSKSKSSDNPDRAKGKKNHRDKSTIMRLNMYKSGKPVRSVDGKIIGGSLLMNNTAGGKKIEGQARIAPNRKWFGNTRTIAQKELDKFREEMTLKAADPYSVVLRRKKIPMVLLQDAKEQSKSMNLLHTESYESVFGSKNTRKRPKLDSSLNDYEGLMKLAEAKSSNYDANPHQDSNIEIEQTRERDMRREDLFAKGQSKRIWGELYKVLDCSDVVLQVVDARNVPGTRCTHVENHIKKNASHKHLVIVINKCDLVPSWVTRKWVKILSKDFPTLAFHASLTNAFGKGALISLLRQYAKLHSDKRQISVGVVGYPNTGKSSVINALKSQKCCRTAPVPGETKVWQYITLMKRIFLIDCPGVVYDIGDDEVELVLKGVVRAERLSAPTDFVEPILSRVKKEYVTRHFGISDWKDGTDFLTQLAQKTGRLQRGGEPDLHNLAGKLPFFVAPPFAEDDGASDDDEVDIEQQNYPVRAGNLDDEDDDISQVEELQDEEDDAESYISDDNIDDIAETQPDTSLGGVGWENI